MDAAVLGNAAIDLPDGAWVLQDGAILLPDGATVDVRTLLAEGEAIDMDLCAIGEEDRFDAPVQLQDEGGYDLVRGPVGFGLAYKGLTDGDCVQAINVARPPATGAFPQPQSLFDECHIVRDVSLLWSGDLWRLAWVDNASGMAELYTAALNESMQLMLGGGRTRLTDNDGAFELRPTLAEIAGRPLLAWISQDTRSNEYWISARWLDEDNEAEDIAILARGASQMPQALALSQIGDDSAALAWVGTIDNPGVWLQALGSDGQPAGSRVRLTDRVSSSSAVSLARRADGGAIAYSAVIDGHPQVRFRRLDRDAQPVADERLVIGSPHRAQDASLHAIGGGYVLTYRSLARPGHDEEEIRLIFLTREGNVQRDLAGRIISHRVSPATTGNGRTDVVVSVEGQVMVAWVDADPDRQGNRLQVVRRRLDCP